LSARRSLADAGDFNFYRMPDFVAHGFSDFSSASRFMTTTSQPSIGSSCSK
jgi:hypothetical protein